MSLHNVMCHVFHYHRHVPPHLLSHSGFYNSAVIQRHKQTKRIHRQFKHFLISEAKKTLREYNLTGKERMVMML